jgi:antitoxin VapB
MAINIKRKETEQLAREVAKLAGENQTEAITKALRERRDRLRRERGAGLAERLAAIGRDAAKRWKEPFRSMTHEQLDDLLYDENGLPK